MNRFKDRGTLAETALARHLSDLTGYKVVRTAQYGAGDVGDLAGLPDLCIEMKNTKTALLPKWFGELERETANAATPFGVVVWSPPGYGVKSIDRWLALEWPETCLGAWRRSPAALITAPVRSIAEVVGRHHDAGLTLYRHVDTGPRIRRLSAWCVDLHEHLASRPKVP